MRALLLALAACAPLEVSSTEQALDGGIEECPPVTVRAGGVQLAAGDSAAPRDLVISNGRFRLELGDYGRHRMRACSGCHVAGAAVSDHFADVQDAVGDYMQFTATVGSDPDTATVLRADGDAVEVAYTWGSVPFYAPYGVVERGVDGSPLYHEGTSTLRRVHAGRLWKTVRVERCARGHYVSLRSDPPLDARYDDYLRSVGTPWILSVAWSSSGAVTRHPGDWTGSPRLDHGVCDWMAGLPSRSEWPFLLIVATATPGGCAAIQYSAGQSGAARVEDMADFPGADGRATPWQAWVGFAEYTSPDLALEPTPAAQQLVTDAVNALGWHQ